MANIKSQIKRNKQNETRRLRNKSVRSEMKTRVKNAVSLAEADPSSAESQEALRLAIKNIDSAKSKGVMHANQAANRKSKLMKRINALKASS